jgi:hypothetical protein
MSQTPMHERINRYVDDWMEHLNTLAASYRAVGMSPEQAEEKATYETRMAIRRAPPLDLKD